MLVILSGKKGKIYLSILYLLLICLEKALLLLKIAYRLITLISIIT
jgi:hypothetical protein